MIVGKFKGQSFYGTGCLIGAKIVLTCAHMLYDRSSKEEARELRFIPGINGNIERPSFEVDNFYYPTEYANSEK